MLVEHPTVSRLDEITPTGRHHTARANLLDLPSEILEKILHLALFENAPGPNSWDVEFVELSNHRLSLCSRVPQSAAMGPSFAINTGELLQAAQLQQNYVAEDLVRERRALSPMREVCSSLKSNADEAWNLRLRRRAVEKSPEFRHCAEKLARARKAWKPEVQNAQAAQVQQEAAEDAVKEAKKASYATQDARALAVHAAVKKAKAAAALAADLAAAALATECLKYTRGLAALKTAANLEVVRRLEIGKGEQRECGGWTSETLTDVYGEHLEMPTTPGADWQMSMAATENEGLYAW